MPVVHTTAQRPDAMIREVVGMCRTTVVIPVFRSLCLWSEMLAMIREVVKVRCTTIMISIQITMFVVGRGNTSVQEEREIFMVA